MLCQLSHCALLVLSRPRIRRLLGNYTNISSRSVKALKKDLPNVPNILPEELPYSMFLIPADYLEILEIINQLDNKRSSGDDH